LWDAIEDEHIMLVGKGSAKAAWEVIHGSERMCDSWLRRLRAEFKTAAFKDGERIDEFSMHISNIAVALRSSGNPCDEEKVVREFLAVVPTCFVQVAFSIETLLDPSMLMVEEVTGHLRAVEERLDGDQVNANGQFLLSKQQWEAKKCQPHGSGSSTKGDGRASGRANEGLKGGLTPQSSPLAQGARTEVTKDKCCYCDEKGH
jgi:hypothetical protein